MVCCMITDLYSRLITKQLERESNFVHVPTILKWHHSSASGFSLGVPCGTPVSLHVTGFFFALLKPHLLCDPQLLLLPGTCSRNSKLLFKRLRFWRAIPISAVLPLSISTKPPFVYTKASR